MTSGIKTPLQPHKDPDLVHHEVGRVELRDYRSSESSPSYDEDVARVRIALRDLEVRGAYADRTNGAPFASWSDRIEMGPAKVPGGAADQRQARIAE